MAQTNQTKVKLPKGFWKVLLGIVQAVVQYLIQTQTKATGYIKSCLGSKSSKGSKGSKGSK